MTNLGSSWNKWDLHIHTPCSLYQNYGGDNDEIWEKFITDLENLPPEINVIGINDYWFLDGYKKVKVFKDNGRLQNLKAIFPVCEFRIKKFSGVDFGNYKRINLHVIFAPNLNVETIDSQFLATLQAGYSLDPNIEDSTWGGAITRQSLIDLGKNIRDQTPIEKRVNLGSDLEIGFGNLNVDEDRIFTQLSGPYFKGKCFTTIGKTEWADIKWSEGTISEKKDIINKVNFIFTCIDSSDDFYKAKKALTDQNVKNLLLDCSDAHNYSDKKDSQGKLVRERLGNVLTWIKAEPTFEGLRQVLYEPNYRIQVSENIPRQPIRKIESVKFCFPENIKIKKSSSIAYQELCIKNLKEIFFSPYFTCLIGSRGTGKSTIINLIAERLGVKTDFFDNNLTGLHVGENAARYNLRTDENNYIEIKGTNEIEFVSQGKVEKLTDGNELTHLIFEERILQPNSFLQDYKTKLKSTLEVIDSQIRLLFQLDKTHAQIKSKTLELTNLESVINSINDPTYIQITKEISSLTTSINKIDASRTKYENLLIDLRTLILSTNINNEIINDYENRITEIITHLLSLKEFEKKEDSFEVVIQTFKNTEDERSAFTERLTKEKNNLTSFFSDKGTSQESINDSQSANENSSRLKSQIQNLETSKANLKMNISTNETIITTISVINEQSISIVQQSIDDLNEKLKIHNENVSPIHYEYHYNIDEFKNGLFKEFQSTFSEYFIPNTSWQSAKEVLFSLEPDSNFLDLTYADFLDKLNNSISSNRVNPNNNYVKMLINIFENAFNFVIYKYLIKKHLFDIFTYIDIKGFYGTRQLNECSFGQKCTAVIVTLLMTGVKPLVIDEPEAHLDNRLIADYLVELIKEKKNDRQIIFATHNANFVVNGDAELIQILEVADNEYYTSITPTTVEDINNRDKLLKLEGGKDAFRKREGKLLIK